MKYKLCFLDAEEVIIQEEYDHKFAKHDRYKKALMNISQCFEGICDAQCTFIKINGLSWASCPHGKNRQLIKEK